MDAGKNYSKCGTCKGTMSAHINVAHPPDHAFAHTEKRTYVDVYAYGEFSMRSGVCAICKVNAAVAGVYCQACLGRETEGMDGDTLF